LFFDQNGVLAHGVANTVEQDTFSANGVTLVGDPFHNIQQFVTDSNGNITHVYETGVLERVPLPDGSVFMSAGRLDFSLHGSNFVMTPDNGKSGDVAAFCAALAGS